MNHENVQYMELGTRIGRGQAFGLVASQSMAAVAKILKGLRDSGDFKSTGLPWDRFCPECIGLSRVRVDDIIDNYEQYGDTYFHLSEIVKISPEAYRAISSKIEDDTIEIDGEKVAIVTENAAPIRAAVHKMRAEMQKAKEKPSRNPVAAAHTRLGRCVAEIRRIDGAALESTEKARLRGAIEDSILRLMEIAERLAA